LPLRPSDPTGLKEVDRVNAIPKPTLQDYISAASDYVCNRKTIGNDAAKAAQIRLSNALGRFLLEQLAQRLPGLRGVAGETPVAGALRTMNSDVTALHPLDGLRLAIEIKPVNLAVGRAIWSRFGDIRAFAVNVHLKFPFAIVGGVLAIPTYEIAKKKDGTEVKRDVTHLINRAVLRLNRAGGRLRESDAAHLLEGVWVLVYDPDTATLDTSVPPPGFHLTLNEFLDDLTKAFEARYFD
jgi:hypothetical protein